MYVCSHSQLAALGNVFKSTEPMRLTEEDTEYSIFCVKHIFDEHVVFQFNCTNTIPEQVLEAVNVVMDLAEAVSWLATRWCWGHHCIDLLCHGLHCFLLEWHNRNAMQLLLRGALRCSCLLILHVVGVYSKLVMCGIHSMWAWFMLHNTYM